MLHELAPQAHPMLPAGRGRKSRSVEQDIRVQRISLKGDAKGSIEVTCVIATELNAPEGAKPVQWRLLTNREVNSLGSVEISKTRLWNSHNRVVIRYVLTDKQWARMSPLCLGKVGDRGRSGKDNRLFVEAVLWIARTGSPWRDLPEHFGKWNTVFKRFRDWVKADVFTRLFEAVSGEPDMEYAMVDATIVRVHRHGQGAKGGLRVRP